MGPAVDRCVALLACLLFLPATRSGEIRLAGLVPISGRNIYQVFTVALSVRRYF
jgi:hypothetical protein